MKKFSLLAMAGVCALGFLTSCGDSSSPDPTRAELCAAGLSAECLVGTWKLNGVTEVDSNVISREHDFSAAPAILTFSENGQFTFVNSAMTHASCNDGTTYGSWSVAGATLTLSTMTGNTCLASRTLVTDPMIKNAGATIEMDIHQIFFMNSEMENASLTEKDNATEVYIIGAE